MKKTLVNVKIRTGRRVRELVQLAVILSFLGLLILGIGALKVYLCRLDIPNRSLWGCLTQ